MNKKFKATVESDIETLIYDATFYSLSDWAFCQALKTLIEKWEQKINSEMFFEYAKFTNR